MTSFKNIIWAYATRDRAFFEKNLFICSLLRKKIECKRFALFILNQSHLKIAGRSPALEISCLDNDGEVYSESIEASKKNVVFIHGADGKDGLLSLQDNLLILDYSRSDTPFYSQMMDDVESVRSTEELERVVYKWVNFYYGQFRSEPIGRIKHRAFHHIGPIAKDIELLHELYENHQWQEFIANLERLRDEWQGAFPSSQSLRSYLARVWYLIVGERFVWYDLGVSPPNDVGLIPALKGERWCLLEILQNNQDVFSDVEDEWQSLLKLLQLSATNRGSFVLNSACGIYHFACLMDDLVAKPEAFNPKKHFVMGFKKNQQLNQEFKEFQKWFHDVNGALNNLGKKCQQIYLSSATDDSATS